LNTKNSTKAMAEAMLTSATTVKTTRNSGGITTKAKCERAQQNWMKKSVDMLRLAQENGLVQRRVTSCSER
jgi:hypothetical protein